MSKKRQILVTGGAGYVGSVLIPKLLAQQYRVKVLDLYIYGQHSLQEVRNDSKLEEIKGDIRDIKLVKDCLNDCDAVIHLACISNDPSAELDPELTQSINHDAFTPLLEACIEKGIRRFIFASSSSVYGISDAPIVNELHPRVPVSAYNISKAYCEDQIVKYNSKDFSIATIRPATVCGYSPRLRLDLTVNILTNHAFHKGEITVFGGDQYRPNLHIEDMADLYIQVLNEPNSKVSGEIFNAGYQNKKVLDIALAVKDIFKELYPDRPNIKITRTPSDDIRSYRISSQKIEDTLNFKPKRTIEDAIVGLCKAFEEKKVPDPFGSTYYYNLARMKEIGLS